MIRKLILIITALTLAACGSTSNTSTNNTKSPDTGSVAAIQSTSVPPCSEVKSNDPADPTCNLQGRTTCPSGWTHTDKNVCWQLGSHQPKPRHRPTPKPKPHVMRVAGLVVSSASPFVVQTQPAPGTCETRGDPALPLPDPHCTPGAVNPDVTPATIQQTICVDGWTKTVRPSESITHDEKLASMEAYSIVGSPEDYEYDHLVPLELGGAVNDARNLWPEPGGIPNDKDTVESHLREAVCNGTMSLRHAQYVIAHNWVSQYQVVPTTTTTETPATTSESTPTGSGLIVHPGSFCSPEGATGVTTAGTPMVCGPASDGRDRWHGS